MLEALGRAHIVPLSSLHILAQIFHYWSISMIDAVFMYVLASTELTQGPGPAKTPKRTCIRAQPSTRTYSDSPMVTLITFGAI